MEFLALEQQPLAVTTARHWALRACQRRGLDEAVGDAVELVTAEIVGNAVKHGEGLVVLTLGTSPAFISLLTGEPVVQRGPVLAVAVTDGGPTRPRPREAGDDAESGRGLALVDALSLNWGVTVVASRNGAQPGGAGKTTWALLTATATPSGVEELRGEDVLAAEPVP